MDNAAHIICIMWNSISGLDAEYHFRFNISCGVAVMGRGHQKKSGIFVRGGEGGKKHFGGEGQFLRSSSFLRLPSFLMSSSFFKSSSFLRFS